MQARMELCEALRKAIEKFQAMSQDGHSTIRETDQQRLLVNNIVSQLESFDGKAA